MKPPCPLINESNVSVAWARAFLGVYNTKGCCGPLLVNVSGPFSAEVSERAAIRDAVDAELARRSCWPVADTAATIFPFQCWRRRSPIPKEQFFAWYLRAMYPRLVKRDGANRYGLYFQRMICSTGVKGEGAQAAPTTVNQLEHVIEMQKGARAKGRGFRQSGLQIACFDPAKDHTKTPRRGFPCLQQLGLTYDSDGLCVHSFYPTECIFDRGYGNYLGLIHLGLFLAHEIGMPLAGLRCYIGHPVLSFDLGKGDLRNLAHRVAVELGVAGAIVPPAEEDAACPEPAEETA